MTPVDALDAASLLMRLNEEAEKAKALTLEKLSPGQRLMRDDAQAAEVTAQVDRRAARLLG